MAGTDEYGPWGHGYFEPRGAPMPEDIRDTIENRRLVSAIMQHIVDSEPNADPEDVENVIIIRLDDLETIVRHHVCGEWHKPWEQYTEQEKRAARA